MTRRPITFRAFCEERNVLYRLWVALEWHGDGDIESAIGTIRDLANEIERELRDQERDNARRAA